MQFHKITADINKGCFTSLSLKVDGMKFNQMSLWPTTVKAEILRWLQSRVNATSHLPVQL